MRGASEPPASRSDAREDRAGGRNWAAGHAMAGPGADAAHGVAVARCYDGNLRNCSKSDIQRDTA